MNRETSKTRTDVLADADTVVVGGCDHNGVFRAKRVPATGFADHVPSVAFSDGIWAYDLEDTLQPPPPDFSHWFPSWERGYGDVLATPDMATLRMVPWLERTALVLCDYAFPDGSPVRIAPRTVLKRALTRLSGLDVHLHLATEFEFVLLRESELSLHQKGYRDLQPLSVYAQTYGATRATADGDFVEELRHDLEGFGIEIEAWGPEAAAGQYELNVRPSDPLSAADTGFLFKQAVKEIALRQGLVATFMSKPAADYGNGLHVHQSLRDPTGNPCSLALDEPHRITPQFRHIIGGQLATMHDFAAMMLPTVNDYKRSVADSAAGTTVTWGADNKTVSLRLLPHGEAKCRVEHRVSGASANVYLVVAALVAGAAHGLEHHIEPPPPVAGNAYIDADVEPLPRSLDEAIAAFESSPVAREHLGEDFVAHYAATRRWELERYANAITDWELRRYLLRS